MVSSFFAGMELFGLEAAKQFIMPSPPDRTRRENYEGNQSKRWHNFFPVGKETYHCHLNYRYVACWTHRQGEIVIEVYYVGSREKAPY